MKLKNIVVMLLFLGGYGVHADELGSFSLAKSPIFIGIEDPHEQARAWGICHATYEFFSQTYAESKPASSQYLHNLSLGAKLAITVSFVTSRLLDEGEKADFPAIWDTGKMMAESIAENSLTQLRMLIEVGDLNELVVELAEINMKICSDNSKYQQMYIDIWRDMYAQGLLVSPDQS